MKSSVDCNFRLDLSVSGCSIVVRYLDSWYVREPQKETICCDADCRAEAILLLMLSLVDSDSFLCRDRAASTLDTITSVGIRFGVTERFSPYDSTRVSLLSKGREEMFLTQLSKSCQFLLMPSTGTFSRFVGSFVGNSRNNVK